VQWLWGGYTVGNPTQTDFSVYIFTTFLIAGLTLIHLILLHKDGSNSPIGSDTGWILLPYFSQRMFFALFCFLVVFGIFVFYFPNTNHPDNYIPADPQTPAHVVPEWYFYRTTPF
jgi:quinol-cytochrome oxidoreductase complex cytochrome b subunit